VKKEVSPLNTQNYEKKINGWNGYKTISITTKSPMDGVQIGALAKYIPTSRLDNVKGRQLAFVTRKD